MRETIGIIIAIFLFSMVYMIVLMIKSAQKSYRFYQENNKLNLEQKDNLKCIHIEKLDTPEKYYNREYNYLVRFENIDTHQSIDLYVIEYDALNVIIDEEYVVNHDGIVLFSIRETII
jgi:hypothetical protein